jgi:putative FmdB family regulatory protein
MPMLDFQCKKCGIKFEELVYAHNRDQVRCPTCSGNELERVYAGKCLFGSLSSGGRTGSSSCAGRSCAGCGGCSH